ncbi:hypothetical protein Rumeso_02493 [Rubellimicrobium mesophilum DSM 19309]|uniref:Uncharacterized protein n=1 Tax=Rubellimicrobium mesophilum DSM 19309 TaxID=442562 RepID=A0A017HP54_9RHOB|nr:hypothetical protein Rumeso_02493 [Rubellimicrobium mesophilum DSM 19309]
MLALGHVRERIPHEVDATPLPSGADHPLDGGLEALVGVRDDQPHAPEASPDEVLQERGPEGLRFGRTDVQAHDLAPAVPVGGHGDYGRHTDDAATLADLEVGGIEPEIGPFAFERALEEGAHPLVDLFAQLRDLALADPAQAHGLHQVVDLARGDPGDPRLLDHRDQRLLGGLPRLQKGREVAPRPELGDAQVERPETGVERAVAIAVAPSRTLATALVSSCSDQSLHVGLHEDLENRLGEGAEKVAIIGLLQRLHQRHPVVGHRVLVAQGEVGQLHLSRTSRWPPRLHRKVHHLRGRYPPWGTVWWYFRRWRLQGVWARVHRALHRATRAAKGQNPEPAIVIMDSQSVKTTEKGAFAALMATSG